MPGERHPAPAADRSAPVVHADGVAVVRGGRTILDDVSLTVRQGEHWALLGANGAGKSTLLGLLGAVTHPSRGTVEVLGRTLGRVDLRELRTLLGHVNPRHPLQASLTVRQVTLTGLTNSIMPLPRWSPTTDERARADALLAMLGMGGKEASRWPDLSQGERGRTLIARSLMPSPRLLLLDEPATGLDLAAREQLLDSLDDLREEHPELATVLVTHHLEELPASTTHAMLLRGGRCVAAGPADEVLTTDRVSDCFGHPVRITRTEGRWAARAQRGRPSGLGERVVDERRGLVEVEQPAAPGQPPE
ncbi:ATP-binding cassette domain-containing protein [Streptomyces sp. AM 2-1-1]|uniref:ABC transporter ATP-binding protein n=1 Tax=Streptomyces sp. AM 2-1-1 TaxID=3028709 RepID=UPI0023B8BEBE|nr:ATP-binding cassette domain-containing protein [Streptomyces sp. AM 2-1-1]WEH43581.1 ATP-binding cassette domain-containing protein [Streptomyces sp. AM 2-1-1]